ncbi:putative RNA polymerase II subunit B1 CTD phosphatase RPAP2 [Branchiostoma lanceolatum]|uniref:putative RNA polymerase II subunit B1 CTD phosphatase RPAP2 n=1 Tax=Branchiostoma lanceolatum TaxID=7740 RepID=UPI0034540E54
MDFFINCAQYIEPSHYTDVMVERAIIGQCGYPVCNNKLPKNKPKQQYHIDTRHNKVYDITERKNCCSNWCYKASQFYKNQLFTSPVWAREKEQPAPVKLLQKERSSEVSSESCSSQGDRQGSAVKDSTGGKQQTTHMDVVPDLKQDRPVLGHTVETDQEKTEKTSGQGAEVKFAKLSLSDTVVEQNVSVGREDCKVEQDDCVGREDRQVASETCEKMFADMDSLREDTLGVEEKIHESQTISKGNEEQSQTQTKRRQEDTSKGMEKKIPSGEGREVVLQTVQKPAAQTRHGAPAPSHVSVAQAVFRSLMEWRTEATFRFLYGDHVEFNLDLPEVLRFTTQEELRASAGVPVQQDVPLQHRGNKNHGNKHHGNKNHGNNSHKSEQITDQKASTVTAENTRKVRFEEDQKDFSQPLSICIPEDPCQNEEEVQLGSLQGKDPKESQDGQVYQGGPDLDPGDLAPATRPLPDLATLQHDAALFQMKVEEFYRGGTQLPAAVNKEELEVKEKKVEDDDRPVFLPPVDSQAQRALQKKILLDRLSRVFPSVLAPLRLSVRDFSTELNMLVKTFRLTSDNIIFRPAELKLLAVVLIHILATKVPVIMQSLYCPETAQFLTSLLRPWRLDLQDLDALVSVMRLG